MRRQARREGTGRPTRYRMRERLVSIGDDFDIEDADGNRAFHVDAKALRLRDTIVLKDVSGGELYRIRERVVRLRETMSIERGRRRVATIQKAFITPLRDRFTVDMADGSSWTVTGNIVDHEYTIAQGGQPIATVSKRWFRVRDTYGVEVQPTVDHALVLAVVTAIDTI
ncbi:LURP-one-related/scramblase family protein [Halobaculum marinum]|uniref:LURP-one-related/scramblase family protein n=1 Tax=Halobaculum marinum TaxID=3031996 RepID=A0ABD5WZN9_9EURY|nr:LURP-one-related family protein [Halobaculum sp. DT55]